MSDFTSGFWTWYVIVLTVGSIAYCAWLLWVTSRVRVKAGPAAASTTTDRRAGKVELMGHTWDGDLAELNNPLPRWWMWLFWITIVFALGYLIAYPGLGSFNGVLGWSSRDAWSQESDDTETRLKPMYEKYAGLELPAIAADPTARAMGERIFLVNCAPCHGSDAGGAPGFPNLRDSDWLYGGDPETIVASISNGRMGVMPAFGTALGADGVKNAVAYVRSLSKLPSDGLRAQLGRALFDENCAACHGRDGKGNHAMGAPNLTDAIWLYGSGEAAIAQTITHGRHLDTKPEHPPMPAFKKTLGQGPLGPAKINLVAGYVWSLSNDRVAGK
jgi:cytochrome c oxidase cbb3-type subunit III